MTEKMNDQGTFDLREWYETVSKPKGLTFTINSVPHRDDLVAWLWSDSVQWGEIFQEESRLKLEIYPSEDSDRWVFDWRDAIAVLWEAGRRLGGDS